jgi:acyl-coenzyme A thioesterase PaaI-like protein
VTVGPFAGREPWPRGKLEREEGGFAVTVAEELCGTGGWLYGGWGMGLLTEAVQLTSQRSLHDLSVNFLRPVAQHRRLRVRCERLASGRALGHYRVDAFDDGELALTGTAVVGPTPGQPEHAEAPRVAPAHECPERPYLMMPGKGVAVMLDVRTAGEHLGVGVASTMLLWGRLRCETSGAVRLAVLSDHVPYLLRRTFSELTRATTVSATLRVVGDPVADWVLFEVSLLTRADYLAVGRVSMWSEGTRLVAVGEQTSRLTSS